MSSPLVLSEDEALELLAFLVTAARTQVDEAKEYGPLRLLSAANRLAEAIAPRASTAVAEFTEQVLPRMPLLAVPRDRPDAYVASLDELCASVAGLLATQFGTVDGAS